MKEIICEIKLPEVFVNYLGVSKKELDIVLQRELALHFFGRGILSFGQARQFAKMSVWDFIDFLRDRKIPLHYDILEFEEDSEAIEELMKK